MDFSSISSLYNSYITDAATAGSSDLSKTLGLSNDTFGSQAFSAILGNATENLSKLDAKAANIDKTKDYSKATDEELMDVCKQFESYFLEQCFKEMLKTVGTDEYSSSATSTMMDYYKDEMVKNIAEQSTNQNSLGLAQQLYDQMKRNYNL